MTRIPCYDKEGNTIKSLTQWDKNQSVYIDDLENGSLPRVHFALGSNAKESKEYKDNVKFDGKKIKITIPNELLKTYAEMYLFLYYGDVESEEPLTTKYMVKIPITKKPQPDDYIYEDNVDYLSIYKLKLELSAIKLDIAQDELTLQSHIGNTDNPHKVDKHQVGLGNVDNTSDIDKPISTAQQVAFENLDNKIEDVDEKCMYDSYLLVGKNEEKRYSVEDFSSNKIKITYKTVDADSVVCYWESETLGGGFDGSIATISSPNEYSELILEIPDVATHLYVNEFVKVYVYQSKKTIKDLKEEVDILGEKIENTDSQVSYLSDQNNEIKNSLATTGESISQLNEDINNISLNKANQTEVDELKGDLGDTQNGNLIFEIKENTYIDKGVEKPYQDWSSTDYIDLTGLKVIDYIVNDTSDLNTDYWSAFYDATKTFIRRINITSGGKIDVDSNAKFVRFSSGTKSIKSLKIKNRFDFQYDFVESEKPYIQQIKNLPVITIPAYYVSHLRDKEATIRGLASKCAKGDSFVFITDTHHSTDYAINGNRASAHDNTNNSIDLIRHIMKNTGTRFIVFGGDCVNTSNGIDEMTHSIASYISRYEETKNNLVYCVGNHEFFSDYPNHTNIPTLETLYGCTAKSNESNYIGADGSFSYFFDNIAQKIRYFVIGSNKDTVVSNETTNWVLEEFQNIPNGYKVICIGHAFLSDDLTAFRGRFKVISEALDALKSKSVYNYVYTQYTTYTYDYTGTNVEPICMITGHTHIDGSISTQGGIPCICTTTDSFYQNHERVNGAVTNVPREKDTINEQAFDVFTIDTVNKKIYTTRIGYGADREFSY